MSTWTKSAQPVLEAGAAGAFDERAAQGPSVLKVGGQYLMWYDAHAPGSGRDMVSVGLATSVNGRTWTRHPKNQVIATEALWPAVFQSLDKPGKASISSLGMGDGAVAATP